jgi:hypothetical protein
MKEHEKIEWIMALCEEKPVNGWLNAARYPSLTWNLTE